MKPLSLTTPIYNNVNNDKTTKLTWLAKYDDCSSMGILSQRLLEQLNDTIDLSCEAIIGKTETKNPLIHTLLDKPLNTDLGIMFSYPDMVRYLDNFKTKVIYTGVDTTGEAGNFVANGNSADFRSNKDKQISDK